MATESESRSRNATIADRETVVALSVSVASLTKRVDILASEVRALVAAGTNKNYPTLIAFMTLILIIIGGAASPYMLRISQNEMKLNKTIEEVVDHRQLAIHPVASETLRWMQLLETERFTARRELIDANNRTQDAVTEWHERLDEQQAEFMKKIEDQRHEFVDRRIDALEKR